MAPALDQFIKDAVVEAINDSAIDGNIISGIIAKTIAGAVSAANPLLTGLTTSTSVDNFVNVDIEGVDNGLYGIGLGEFFLLIGLFVGTLMHTFVYDRAKRGGAKISHSQ